MNIETGMSLGTKLCHALGLDPRLVTRITVTCDAEHLGLVTVERVVIKENDLERVFNTYQLEPKPVAPPEDPMVRIGRAINDAASEAKAAIRKQASELREAHARRWRRYAQERVAEMALRDVQAQIAQFRRLYPI